MKTLASVIRERMDALGISQTELGKRLGMAQQAISAILGGDVAAPRKWREMAEALEIPEDEMRTLMVEATRVAGKTTRLPKAVAGKRGVNVVPSRPAGERRLPVLGRAVGGDSGLYEFNGAVIDYAPCPPWLADVDGAYGVYVDGESMVPRYRPGELVYVHPNRPPRKGDDVVVQIDGGDGEGAPPRGFIKTYVGYMGDKLMLEQYNPAGPVEFVRGEVVSVHTIVGRMG